MASNSPPPPPPSQSQQSHHQQNQATPNSVTLDAVGFLNTFYLSSGGSLPPLDPGVGGGEHEHPAQAAHSVPAAFNASSDLGGEPPIHRGGDRYHDEEEEADLVAAPPHPHPRSSALLTVSSSHDLEPGEIPHSVPAVSFSLKMKNPSSNLKSKMKGPSSGRGVEKKHNSASAASFGAPFAAAPDTVRKTHAAPSVGFALGGEKKITQAAGKEGFAHAQGKASAPTPTSMMFFAENSSSSDDDDDGGGGGVDGDKKNTAGTTKKKTTAAATATTTTNNTNNSSLRSTGEHNAMNKAKLPKSSNLDAMFEELKKKEAERASQKEKHQTQNAPTAADNDNNSIHVSDFYEPSELGGSHAGPCDTRTTNLFVGNLPPEVDEEILMTDFGKYGDIASVKIMWPRTADETARKRNSGFVAFMRREAAEKAIDAMAGHVYFGNPMRVGWGKTVPLPPVPLYVSPTSSSKQDRAAATATAGAALPPTSSMPHGQYNAHFTAQFDVQPHQPALDVAVSIPQDPEVSFRCDVLAHYVALHGLSFEAEVLKREKDNPLFQFIDDSSSPDHLYYRWRIYSCCQGDDTRHWRTAPFQMVEGGGMWTPPPPPALVTLPGAGAPLPRGSGTGGASADDNGETVVVGAAADSKRIGRALTPGEASDLRATLDDLTMQRQSVRRAMAACLDASEASEDVVDVLCAPFEEVLARANDTATTSTWASSIAATPAGLVARLYVMSDVLHNAGQAVESGLARGASSFRTLFECRLPSAFRAIKLALRSLGRLSGEEMKGRCLCVLKAWSAWRCFPDKFVSDLHDLLV